MTEQEWLTCADPKKMLSRCIGLSDRKARLFAVAGTRMRQPNGFWEGRLEDDLFVYARAEQLADTGVISVKRYDRAYCEGLTLTLRDSGLSSAHTVVICCEECLLQTLADLLRMIVGNPWRPVKLPKVPIYSVVQGAGYTCPWLTPTVLSIAEQAYAERPKRKCEKCGGSGSEWKQSKHSQHHIPVRKCSTCHGTGTIEDGRLDQDVLNVLADALIDAGMPETELQTKEVLAGLSCPWCGGKAHRGRGAHFDSEYHCNKSIKECNSTWFTPGDTVRIERMLPHPILAALRSDESKYRGFWALDVILGKE